MKITDITQVLKSALGTRRVRMKSNGFEIHDGEHRTWDVASGKWVARYEIGFEDLRFLSQTVTYGELRPSGLPNVILPEEWIFDNWTDEEDNNPLTVSFSFTEIVSTQVSTTLTEGRNTAMQAGVSFELPLKGRLTASFAETINTSFRAQTTTTQTRTNTRTENWTFKYPIPPMHAVVVKLTKELGNYEINFSGRLTVDGAVYVLIHDMTKGLPTKKWGDGGWGLLSEYLSEQERTFEVNGSITEIVGSRTRRSVRKIRLEGSPPTMDKAMLRLHGLDKLHSRSSAISRADVKVSSNAEIRSVTLNAIDDDFDVLFEVTTLGCFHSSCGHFDATLVMEIDGAEQRVPYTFEGWSVADSGSDVFYIWRHGSRGGLVLDIVDIESPIIVCDDTVADI